MIAPMDERSLLERMDKIEAKLDQLLAALARVEPWIERLSARKLSALVQKPRS